MTVIVISPFVSCSFPIWARSATTDVWARENSSGLRVADPGGRGFNTPSRGFLFMGKFQDLPFRGPWSPLEELLDPVCRNTVLDTLLETYRYLSYSASEAAQHFVECNSQWAVADPEGAQEARPPPPISDRLIFKSGIFTWRTAVASDYYDLPPPLKKPLDPPLLGVSKRLLNIKIPVTFG